jgi:hypothetical protein
LDEIAAVVYEEKSGQAFVYLATHRKTHFYQKAITQPKIIQPENPCNMRKDLSYQSIL